MRRSNVLAAAFVVSGCALALLAAPAGVLAQGVVSIRIQPAIIEERIEPGETIHFTLRVSNLDESPKKLYISTRNIEGLGAGGSPLFGPDEGAPYGLKSWISIPPAPLALTPGETKELPLSIAAPKSALPGSHFGAVVLSSDPQRPTETGVGIGYEVATIITLRIPGDALEDARIREFSTEKSVYSFPPVGFTARVENLGNTLIRPRGPLDIVDLFGKKVGELRVNEEAAGIFPRAERTFEASFAPAGFAVGRYQAVLSLAYGDDARKTISSSLSFWILPLRLIMPILAGIVILVVGSYAGIRFYIRKKIREIAGGAAAPRDAPAAALPSRLLFKTIIVLLFALLLLAGIFLLFG